SSLALHDSLPILTSAHQDLPSEPFPAEPDRSEVEESDAVEEGTVPDVSGMVLSEAQAAVEAACYDVEVEQESHDSVDQWYVIGTDPAAGTDLPEGRTVTIRQSSGRG